MIENGSKVRIHYTLKVDEELIDSSTKGEPFSYIQGQGQIIPGLEEALEGLDEGEKKTVVLPPEKAYGPRDPQAMREVPKSAFQKMDSLKVGDWVQGEVNNRQFQAVVAEIKGEDVVLDLNHPLAGKTLEFEVEVLEVAS